MKTLLSIFAFAMTLITSAQYHSLISEDKVWKGITYGWGEFPFYQRILGDSLINDVVYSKVWNAQTLVGDQYNIGLIREDVEQQKVYLWNGITEALLYDFSAESGDVVLIGGKSRLAYHGVDRIYPRTSTLLKQGGRINLTMRRVNKVL